jgi:hypothetical protein
MVGIPFLAIGVGAAWQERRYAREGVVVEGIVLKDLRGRVRYRFLTPDGEEVEGRARVAPGPAADRARSLTVVRLRRLVASPSAASPGSLRG